MKCRFFTLFLLLFLLLSGTACSVQNSGETEKSSVVGADIDSIPEYLKLMKQGDARASYIISAMIYARDVNGRTVPGLDDYNKGDARNLCRYAAFSGYAPAQYSYALLIEHGDVPGTEEDIVNYLTLSADQGNELAKKKLKDME